MKDEETGDARPANAEGADHVDQLDEDSIGRAAAVVRVLCIDGELSRAIIGYGDSSEEAYENAVAEARAFCRHHGGTQKITKL